MTGKEAEQTLSVIRTLMERGTRYTNLSGNAGIAAGVVTLLGCAMRVWLHTPFLSTWLGVLIAACGSTVYFTAEMAYANGEPFWTRQTRTVVIALMPAFAAGLILTAALARLGQEALLPGAWMVLWGVGALAMAFFTPRVISFLGVAFLAAGAYSLLFAPPMSDALQMGLTFGALHLAYGALLTAARHSALAATPLFRNLC
jgi:hypothetical protein